MILMAMLSANTIMADNMDVCFNPQCSVNIMIHVSYAKITDFKEIGSWRCQERTNKISSESINEYIK